MQASRPKLFLAWLWLLSGIGVVLVSEVQAAEPVWLYLYTWETLAERPQVQVEPAPKYKFFSYPKSWQLPDSPEVEHVYDAPPPLSIRQERLDP